MNVKKNKIERAIFPCVLLAGILPNTNGSQNPANQPPDSLKTNPLTVIVTDRDERVVTDLTTADFNVYKDGEPQRILSVSITDVPACIGITLDTSRSTRPIRSVLAAAIYNFVKVSNPDDETFLVNFNGRAYLDTDFTKDPERLRDGLSHMDAQGNTALFDAVIASAAHLAKRPACARRILLVLSNGRDNASAKSLQQTLTALEQSSGVIVYAIGLSSEQGIERRALEHFTLQTGWVAWVIDNLKH